MSTSYRQSDLITAIWDSKIEQNAASQIDQQGVCNFAVREVLRELDIRSSKRLSSVVDMFDDIYDYACPADIKGEKIIDVVPQVNRTTNFETVLTTAEEFDRRKSFDKTLIAFNDHDLLRKLRMSLMVNSQKFIASSLDSITDAGGTWVAFGDAQNLRVDSQNYVEGNGSLAFDIASGGSVAFIRNNPRNAFDISAYINQGSVFIYAYIQDPTKITNFILAINPAIGGYQMTVTQTNEGNAFSAGWNLLRFDFASGTVLGSPDPTKCIDISIVMTKDITKSAGTGYRFDAIIFENGVLNSILYYTKYLWLDSSTQAYKENASAAGDYLVCDTEEFNLFVLRGKMESDRRLRDWNAFMIDQGMYESAKASYKEGYYSEAKSLTQTYYDTEATLNYSSDMNTIIEPQAEGQSPPLT